MKHVFYFLAIFPILWELSVLVDLKKYHDYLSSLQKMKGKKLDEFSSNQKALVFLMLGYFIWTFIGIFSSQWIIFLGLIVLGLIPKRYAWHRWIDGLISFIALIFIILNAYHFKINVWELILANMF